MIAALAQKVTYVTPFDGICLIILGGLALVAYLRRNKG